MMLVLANQISFDFQRYGTESMIKESAVKTVYFGDWQSRTMFEISKTELGLQDLAVNLDELTGLDDDTVFRLKQNDRIPFKNEKDLVQGAMI